MVCKEGEKRTTVDFVVRAEQRTSPASLAAPCLPQWPHHSLLGPESFDEERRGRTGMGSVGWVLLEHITAAGSTTVLQDPPSYAFPPKHRDAHSSGRRFSESAKCLHFGGPRSRTYLPWQRHRQLPLLSLHSPSPASAAGRMVSTSRCPRMASSTARGATSAFKSSPCPMQKCQSGCRLSTQYRALDAKDRTHGTSGHQMGGGRSE